MTATRKPIAVGSSLKILESSPERPHLEGWLGILLIFTLIAIAPGARAGFYDFSSYTAYSVGGAWGEAAAIGDVNNDGRNDVVMCTSSYGSSTNRESILVYRQDGSGHLLPPLRYPAGGAAYAIVIADLNGDGLNDVAVGKKTAGIRVFLQDTNGTLQNYVDYVTANAYLICAGDFDHDGRCDLAGIGWSSGLVDVFKQTAQGTLGNLRQYSASYGGNNDLKAGDVNDDGLCDIVVCSGQGYAYNNVALLVQTNGDFAPVSYLDLGGNELTGGVGIGDASGDGRNDVVVSYGGNRPASFVRMFRRIAGGGFTIDPAIASYDIPKGISVIDVDMNGLADIVTAHSGYDRVGVYYQTAPGVFGAEQLFVSGTAASQYAPNAWAIGDFTGDDMPDIAIADHSHGLVVLNNNLPWPHVRLTGVTKNSAGQIVISSQFRGADGRCTVHASSDLINWTNIGVMTGAFWADTNSTVMPKRFYRVAD